MSGEKDLKKLLVSMSPTLIDGESVFCTFEHARYGDHRDLEPLAAIQESEGLTLIIPRSKADEYGYAYESSFRRISLGVHSSLDAVGLTAAVSNRLSEHGISANVVAGFFHDHLFVPSRSAEKALEALVDFAR